MGELEPLSCNVGQACHSHLLVINTGLLEHALVRDASSELQLSALEALLEVAGTDPAVFAEQYSHRMSWLRGFLNHHDAAGQTQSFPLISTYTSVTRPIFCIAVRRSISE